MFQIPLPLAQLVLSAVNHVTRQQPQLRHALQAHAGQVLRITVLPPGASAGTGRQVVAARPPAPGSWGAPPARHGGAGATNPTASASAGTGAPRAEAGPWLPTLQTDARIGVDGSLAAVSGEEPAVTLTARLDADTFFKVLQQGPMALGASLRIEGNVRLASALGEVARALHWDVEEDLSRLVGDVAAHRAGNAMRQGRIQIDALAARAQELLGDHLAGDHGVLASRAEASRLAAELHQLEARIIALEQRAAALARREGVRAR